MAAEGSETKIAKRSMIIDQAKHPKLKFVDLRVVDAVEIGRREDRECCAARTECFAPWTELYERQLASISFEHGYGRLAGDGSAGSEICEVFRHPPKLN